MAEEAAHAGTRALGEAVALQHRYTGCRLEVLPHRLRQWGRPDQGELEAADVRVDGAAGQNGVDRGHPAHRAEAVVLGQFPKVREEGLFAVAQRPSPNDPLAFEQW